MPLYQTNFEYICMWEMVKDSCIDNVMGTSMIEDPCKTSFRLAGNIENQYWGITYLPVQGKGTDIWPSSFKSDTDLQASAQFDLALHYLWISHTRFQETFAKQCQLGTFSIDAQADVFQHF